MNRELCIRVINKIIFSSAIFPDLRGLLANGPDLFNTEFKTWVDGAVLICLGLAAPWPVLGLWNAAIGLWQLGGRRDPDIVPDLGSGLLDGVEIVWVMAGFRV